MAEVYKRHRLPRLHSIAPLLALAVSSIGGSLSAQVFQVGGGTSTLYQAGGGSITLRAPSYDLSAGAGTMSGHVIGGARLVKSTPAAKYILGDDRIDFRFPTDVFDTSHFLLARGIGISIAREGKADILAFVGATATDFGNPLFEGAKTDNPAGILFLTKKLNSHWQLQSDTIVSRKTTEIEALRWEPLPKVALAVAAGVGANQPYAAASLTVSRPRIDLQAAYIQAGQQFHRVALVSPLLTEPDRENLLVTFRPTAFLSLTVAHQNFLVPQYPALTNLRSSVDQGSTGLTIAGIQMNGTIYRSTYQDESNHAVSLSATRDFSQRFRVMANYLAARPRQSAASNSFISNFTETLSSRLSVTESVTTSAGHTGVDVGGQWLSNFLSVSADYETYYVPADNSAPFERALVLDIKMKLFGRLTLHGASYVDPTGHIRDTVDANTLYARNQADAPLMDEVKLEPAVMRGCVVDEKGELIEGAALLIDKKLIYTDSKGCFFLREHKPRTHALYIVLTEFLAQNNWFVISAPSTISSSLEGEKTEISIVVVLKHVRIEDTGAVDTKERPLCR